MNKTNKEKILYLLIYCAIFIVTIYFSIFAISNYITQKKEYELFKQSWQYVADTNIELKTDTNEDGTTETYYAISTPEQLAGMFEKINSNDVNADSISTYGYKLTKNIDLSNKTWYVKNFSKGLIFDGNSFHIQNLKIQSSLTNVGFVGTLNGTIKNVYFDNASVTNTDTSGNSDRTGIVAGYVDGGEIINATVDKNCYVTGNVYKNNSDRCAGGIAGFINNDGEIINCINYAKISTAKFIGGIVGKMNSGTISGCINKSNNFSSGTNEWPRVGGIVAESSGKIEYCVNLSSLSLSASVSGDIRMGGIVGHNVGDVSTCANKGSIIGGTVNNSRTYIGGIAGYSTSKIDDCYNSGDITSKAKTIITSSDSDISVSISVNKSQHGHTFYYTTDDLMLNSDYYYMGYQSYDSNLTITNINAYAGGICGRGESYITHCYNKGKIVGGSQSISASISEKLESSINDYRWSKKEKAVTYYFTVYIDCKVGAINGYTKAESMNQNVISASNVCQYGSAKSSELKYYSSINPTTKTIKGKTSVKSQPATLENTTGFYIEDAVIYGELNQEIVSTLNSYKVFSNPKYRDSGYNPYGGKESCSLKGFFNSAQTLFEVNNINTTLVKDKNVTFTTSFSSSNLTTLGESNWFIQDGEPRLKNLYW